MPCLTITTTIHGQSSKYQHAQRRVCVICRGSYYPYYYYGKRQTSIEADATVDTAASSDIGEPLIKDVVELTITQNVLLADSTMSSAE